MKINWNFLGGEGGAKQKPSVGGVLMDIFWNCIIIITIVCLTISSSIAFK